MCIVVDTNTLASVFKRDSVNHLEFKPVLDWVQNGKGKFVFGGTKYLEELGESYRKLFILYRSVGKAVFISNDDVDSQTVWAANQITDPDFDDQHLIGLLRVSGCRLVCSLDSRAYPFFRHSTFFSPSSRKPKIYSSRGNEDLLTDTNIADCCKPTSVTTKAQKKSLGIN